MRIYLIEDFKQDSLRQCQTLARKLHKGFLRCGHDVIPFSYRDMQKQRSLFGYTSSFAKRISERGALEVMTTQIRDYQPDVILLRAAVRKLDEQFIQQAKQAAPNAVIVCWYVAMSAKIHPNILATAKMADFFISTGGGENLRRYKNAGVQVCAYLPYPCDPDLEHHYDVEDKWKTDLLFTGTVSRTLPDQDPMRKELIERLVKEKGMKVWGGFGNPEVYGMDYMRAISGAKIGISINEFNDVRYYHSNRFMNYLSCGTMVAAKYVPGSELLFADGKQLRYFTTIDECMELAEYYLAHPAERAAIAAAGMERAHAEFNCEKIARYALELIKTGRYDAPWAEIL